VGWAADQGVSVDRGPAASATLSPSGSYLVGVPLDWIPAPAGGLTLGLGIVNGEARSRGPIGVGWQLPLSYVRLRGDHAGRPPTIPGVSDPLVTLSLAGSTTELHAHERGSVRVVRTHHPGVCIAHAHVVHAAERRSRRAGPRTAGGCGPR
jgi:hypothetical protein